MGPKMTPARARLLSLQSIRLASAGFALLLAALAAPSAASAAYVGTWFWQNPIPQGRSLTAIDFAGDTGWAVGDGVVLRTLNGGSQWAVQYGFPAVAGRYYTDVEAVDSNTVWVLASDGAWLHSGDGGETWQDRKPQGGTKPQAVEFVDASNGWIADSENGAWRTTDGGETWSQFPLPCGKPSLLVRRGNQMLASDGIRIAQVNPVSGDATLAATLSDYVTSIAFGDANNVVGVSFMGMYTRSTNGGRTWTAMKPVSRYAIDLNSVVFTSSKTGYAFGYGQTWRTIDAGDTWSRYFPTIVNRAGTVVPMKPFPNGFTYANGRWFTVGGSGTIMYSLDKGVSWRYVSGDFFDRLVDISFESTRSGMVLAEKTAYRTSDGGATWARHAMPYVREYTALSIAPNRKGWAVGSGKIDVSPYYVGAIFRTTDGGRTFTKQSVPSAVTDIYDVWTNDGTTAWAAGAARGTGFRGILKTTDGGAHWRQVPIDWSGMTFEYPEEDRPIYSITVHPSGIGYARATNEKRSLATTNAGETWFNAGLAGTAFAMVSSETVIAGSWSGSIWKRTYPSTTWVRLTGLDKPIDDLRFISSLIGYATADGAIYRTEDGGSSWTFAGTGGVTRIATAGESDAWAVGYGGAILYNGGVDGDFVPPTTRTSAPAGWDDADFAYVGLSAIDQTGIDGTWWAIGEPTPETSETAETSTSASSVKTLASGLTYLPYKGRIKISAEGVTPITFYSRDANGNLERPRTVRVMLDRRKPTISSDAKSLYGGSATVKITGADTGCGVKYTYYSIDGRRPVRTSGAVAYAKTGLGTHSVVYWSVDRLGHISTKVAKRFTVRPKATISISTLPTTTTVDTTYAVSGTLSPRHTSPAPVVLRAYRLDGEAWVAGPTVATYTRNTSVGSKYAARITLPSTGSWKIMVTHQDSAHYLSRSTFRYTTCIE